MAFNRIVEATIGTGNAGTIVSDLDIDFDIVKTTTENVNTAVFAIYNLSQKTADQILKPGNTILFKAGYDDDGTGLIWAGKIDYVAKIKQDADWVFEVHSTDAGNTLAGLERFTVSCSFVKDTPASTVLNFLTAQMGGVVINGSAVLSSLKLSSGFVFAGTIRQALLQFATELKKNQIRFYLDNGEFYLFNEAGVTPLNTVLLSERSGLIGVPEKIVDQAQSKEDWIRFTALLNHRIGLNSIVTLKSNTVNGSYFAKKVVYKGNNYGGDFLVEVEAVA